MQGLQRLSVYRIEIIETSHFGSSGEHRLKTADL
jgi:hypothetical protein